MADVRENLQTVLLEYTWHVNIVALLLDLN